MPAPESGSPMTYMHNGKQHRDRDQRRELQRRVIGVRLPAYAALLNMRRPGEISE
ncbi:MAG: hypothetical protein Udaeo2_28440 [Candidatus Udaeobacter sp.]|nr:MAG: hypothetical protein Udaeo2_28440 [Candidatus Udaeobacter sp.]